MAQIDYGMLFKAYRQSWYNESKISQMVWDVPQDYADFLSDFELYNSKFLEYGEPRGANFSKVLDAMVDDQRNISRRRLITIKGAIRDALVQYQPQVDAYNELRNMTDYQITADPEYVFRLLHILYPNRDDYNKLFDDNSPKESSAF